MSFHFTPKFVTSSIITLVICCFGLVGNFLCAVVLFSRHMTRSSYIYILQGLAVSDICLLTLSVIRTLGNLEVVHLPQDTYTQTTIFFWDWISTSSTKYYTVMVSIERFFVIWFPFLAHSLLTTKRSKVTAFSIFGFCLLLSCFSYVYIHWIDPLSFHIYVAIVLHFVPFILVVVFNLLVFIGLRKIHQRTVLQTSTMKEDEYNVTKMLFAIVLVFGICYSFEFVRRMMNYMYPGFMTSHDYYEYTINNLADIFYVLNSSANFVIYSLLGKNFREVFCKVFRIRSGSLEKEHTSDFKANSNGSQQENQHKNGNDNTGCCSGKNGGAMNPGELGVARELDVSKI